MRPRLPAATPATCRLRGQSVTLAELLEQHAEALPPMRLERRAIVHGHCHHTSVMRMDPDRRLLDRTGLRWTVLDSGCCGMAGALGFERELYDVSMAAGERVLLPAVREAPRDALIVADGFSCREQIAQATDRRALHLAEVLRMAMQSGPQGPAGDLPERGIVVDHSDARLRWWQAALILALAGGLLAAGTATRRAAARASTSDA